jgi:hypothetical protein
MHEINSHSSLTHFFSHSLTHTHKLSLSLSLLLTLSLSLSLSPTFFLSPKRRRISLLTHKAFTYELAGQDNSQAVLPLKIMRLVEFLLKSQRRCTGNQLGSGCFLANSNANSSTSHKTRIDSRPSYYLSDRPSTHRTHRMHRPSHTYRTKIQTTHTHQLGSGCPTLSHHLCP